MTRHKTQNRTNQNKTKITQKELKQAYSMVTNDLFQSLVKVKTGQSVQIGSLGSFGSLKKTEHRQKCGWEEPIISENSKGEEVANQPVYVYYKLKFTPSAKLKQELNQVLENKYR